MPKVRAWWSERVPVVVLCGPGVTQQSFKDECDLNVLVARYRLGATDPVVVGKRQAFFGDFTSGLGLLEAHQLVQDASEAFMTLPAKVRDRFGNDPVALLAFLEDEGNRAEAVSLGLIPPPAPTEGSGTAQGAPAGASGPGGQG